MTLKDLIGQRSVQLILAGIIVVALYLVITERMKSPTLFFLSPSCQIPCAFNITPGTTSYADADNTLSTKVGTAAGDGYFTFENAGTVLYVKAFPADPRQGNYVRTLEISSFMQGKVVSLGDLINLGLTPHSVFRNEVTITPNGLNLLITFGADDQIIAELSPANTLDAQSIVNTLTLSSKQDANGTLLNALGKGHYSEEVSWIGYTDISKYMQLPTQ